MKPDRNDRLGGDIDSREYCEIATDEGFNLCISTEDAFREAAKFLGFDDRTLDDLFPLEELYMDVLGEGLDEDKCTNMRELAKWVISRAWQVFQEGDTKSVVIAFRLAWRDAQSECGGSSTTND